jgi:tight adherence protein B
MMLPLVVFIAVVGIIMGSYAAVAYLPSLIAGRQVERRLREVSISSSDIADAPDATVVMRPTEGPVPAIDHLISRVRGAAWLPRLIEQAGLRMAPSAVVLMSVGAACACGLLAALFARQILVIPFAAAVGGFAPFGWLVHRRSGRLKRFEEQFPEALDLLSRAIRAGHAFQTALGMAADELPAPAGPEFKKTFDQQNFGRPLRDALNNLSDRVTLLDVRFFVTAVLIQRETGGNLSEILDNLAHVVRERFKILRQVRVHTAHGRFTGYVLLALPAFLAIALSILNPEHMRPLFRERMGQMMLVGAMLMQTVGFLWIRKVIRIEV